MRSSSARARKGTGVAVLFLDLDHFKNINDTLGHRVGDLMLIEVAAILRNSVRSEDQVVRIGGDEFMVVIRSRATEGDRARDGATHPRAALGTPIRVENQRLSVTSSSIGIAVYPDHGRAPDALIRSADLAMYRAKENGKNRFEFFSALLAQRSERRSAVKGALKLALQKDALRLYFQPRVRIADGNIVGAETLLRWTDPRLGVVSPKEFIVIAEESGLIHELGVYVFRKACRQLRDWQDRDISLGILSVNFSAHQLLVATFIDEVDQVIEETGVDPHFIEVEITETSMLFDLGVTRNVIAELKHRGMRIAIDDFGTGFSSLSHLQQLDVDTLKIDQSFIRDMLDDAGDAAITTSVISLARGLGLATTAEGVEQEKQLEGTARGGLRLLPGLPVLAGDRGRGHRDAADRADAAGRGTGRLARSTLPDLLEEADRGGGRHVERLDRAGLRDAHRHRRRRQYRIDALPLVTEQPRDRAAQIGVMHRALGVRAGCNERDLARAFEAREVAVLEDTQVEVRAHRGAHDLRRPGARTSGRQVDVADAGRGSAAQDGADVARILDAVEQHRVDVD